MSDSNPPKPKPGSLRDRIAAFEQKPAANPEPSYALPRPKPAGVAREWKPKPLTPPASPGNVAAAEERKTTGTMSASDAKESIGKGVSLKERMAALQGKGAFGAGPALPPPIPSSGPKPTWKKPTPPSPPDGIVEAPVQPSDQQPEEDKEAPSGENSPATEETHDAPPAASEEADEQEKTPEEEERERRAAIAARMARLGGARLGMGPPVFGIKPNVPKRPVESEIPKPSEDIPAEQPMSTLPEPGTPVTPTEELGSAPVAEDASQHEEKSVDIQDSQPTVPLPPPVTSSLPSPPEDVTSPSESVRSAGSGSSANLLVGPKRAGPPRKKKAVVTPQVEVPPEPEASSAQDVPVVSPTEEAVAEAASIALPPSRKPTLDEHPIPAPDIPAPVGDEPVTTAEVERDDSTEEKHLDVETNEAGEVSLAQEAKADELDVEGEQDSLREDDARSIPQSQEIDEDSREDEDDHHKERESSVPLTEDSAAELPPRSITPTSDSVRGSVMDEDEDEHEDYGQVGHVEMERDPTMRVSGYEGLGVLDTEPGLHGRDDVDEDELLTPKGEKRQDESVDHGLITFGVQPSEPTIHAHADPVAEENDGLPETDDVGKPEEPHRLADEEEDETARKKRIAERLARMGGFNPFGAPLKVPKSVIPPPISSMTSKDQDIAVSPRQVTDQSENIVQSDESEAPAPPPRGHEATTPDVEGSQDDEEQGDDPGAEPDIPPVVIRPTTGLSTEPKIAPPEAHWTDDDDEQSDGDEEEMPPPRITRPIPAIPPAAQKMNGIEATMEQPSPPVPTRKPIPNPPTSDAVPPLDNSSDSSNEQRVASPVARSVSPRRKSPPAPIIPPDSSQEEPTSPSSPVNAAVRTASPRRSIPRPPVPSTDLVRQQSRSISPSARVSSPRRSIPVAPKPLIVEESMKTPGSPKFSRSPERQESPPATPRDTVPRRPSSPDTPPKRTFIHKPGFSIDLPHLAPEAPHREDSAVGKLTPEEELMEDEDTDPIDPTFISSKVSAPPTPSQSCFPARSASPPRASQLEQDDPTATSAEDAEGSRRRTLAERMARLGGVKFGALPPVPQKRATVSIPEDGAHSAPSGPDSEVQPEEETVMSEEDERERRRAIAARLASKHGVGMGMFQTPLAPQLPSIVSPSAAVSPRTPVPPPPPSAIPPKVPVTSKPSAPPPPPVTAEHDSESDMLSLWSEGNQPDSEIEEINVEEAEEGDEPEEHMGDVPPPVPNRTGRPAVPVASPPIVVRPTTMSPPAPPSRPPPPPANKEFRPSTDSSRTSPTLRDVPTPASDFVMVEDEAPLTPPPRSSRSSHVSRSLVPPSRISDNETGTIASSQWELPSIPSGSLDLSPADVDMSLSTSTHWSEDSTSYGAVQESGTVRGPSSAAPQGLSRARSIASRPQPSADDLMAIWGKVGTQILSVSNALYARSKSALIGDGSFEGFVDSVLSNVPSAASPSEPFVYGHLVYSQTVSSVTRRVSDILPGDVVVLEDCHFHGRKGLQTYNTRIGKNDQPACGIINEYEQKKHKLRVYQANQHVGNQTVELASYRLNDLKAGTVKIYRVAEA